MIITIRIVECSTRIMSQEPLQYLPPERWSELQSAFKRNWPRGFPAFSVLAMQKQWADREIDYDFKVYCPFGEVQNGMVVVNKKEASYELIIQCPSDDLGILRTTLLKTKIIDWKRSIKIPYAPHNIIELIKSLSQDIHVKIESINPSGIFILDTKTPYENVNLPTDITFKHLTSEYVELINSTWPHRYPSSSTYFKLLIDNKYGYGLFLNDTLICWLLVNESGNLSHLHTVPEHRQKGYAELILKLVSNILIENGMIVSSYVRAENLNACKLHKKLGFVKIYDIAWCYLSSTYL